MLPRLVPGNDAAAGPGARAVVAQLCSTRVVTNWMEAETQGALAAAERAEEAEQKAAG